MTRTPQPRLDTLASPVAERLTDYTQRVPHNYRSHNEWLTGAYRGLQVPCTSDEEVRSRIQYLLTDLSLHAWAAVRFVRRRVETDGRVVGRPISTRKRLRKFLTR